MATFSTKQITTAPSVGEKLTARRQQNQVSLEDAAASTKISTPYLWALEEGDYDKLPGEVYAKSFLKVYAEFLRLNPQELVSQYISEQKIYNKTQQVKNIKDNRKPVERIFWHHLLVTPKIIRNGIIGLLIIVCLVYLGIKVNAIVSPPFLEVTQPPDNLVTKQKVVEITGQVEKEAVLEINGQQVLTKNDGNFSEMLALQQGTNIIEISAQKKHSKKAVIYRKVIVVEEEIINNVN